MEGLSRILGQISADARTEAEAILAAARAEADALLKAAADRAQSESQRALEQARTEAQAHLMHSASAAALEARKALLAVKRQAVDHAFLAAQRSLSELSAPDYKNLLIRLACEGAYTGYEAVLFNPEDRSRYGQQVVAEANQLRAAAGLVANLTLSEETRPLPGGLMLQQGPVETICTLDRLIADAKATLEVAVASCLFDSATSNLFDASAKEA